MAIPHPGQNYAAKSAFSHAQDFDQYQQNRQLNQGQIATHQANAAHRNAQAAAEPLNARAAYEKAMAEQMTARQNAMHQDRTYGLDVNKHQLDVEKNRQSQAQHDPMAAFNNFVRMYETSPEGSPQKAYAGQQVQRMLSGMGAQGGGVPKISGMGNTGGAQSVGGMGAQTLPNGDVINPTTAGQHSLKGASTSTLNPDGTYTQRQSATTGTESTAQSRLFSEAETGVLWKPVQEGIKPYSGAWQQGKIQMAGDVYDYKYGSPAKKEAARKRLVGLALALKLAPETSGAVARMQYGGNATEGQQKHLLKSQLGNLASHEDFITKNMPQEIFNEATEKYYPLQKKALETGVEEMLGGFAQTSKNKPHYVGEQQPSYQLKMVNGKAQMVPVMGASSQPAVNGMGGQPGQQQPPKWNHTDDEYNAWKKSQGMK